jgi:uncharacterized lipoprotein YehR (DUF1307 family)
MKSMSLIRILFVSSLLVFSLAACGDDDGGDDDVTQPDADTMTPDGGTPDAFVSPACLEAENHSDFQWINQNILGKSCANFSACHDKNGPEEGLDLTESSAYAALFDVDAEQVAGKKRVKSGGTSEADCADSYLYNKLTNTQVAPGKKSMPLNSPLLCQQKLDAVCRWIAAGAPND